MTVKQIQLTFLVTANFKFLHNNLECKNGHQIFPQINPIIPSLSSQTSSTVFWLRMEPKRLWLKIMLHFKWNAGVKQTKQ